MNQQQNHFSVAPKWTHTSHKTSESIKKKVTNIRVEGLMPVKCILVPPVVWAAVRFMIEVLLLIHCFMFLPLFVRGSVFGPYFILKRELVDLL